MLSPLDPRSEDLRLASIERFDILDSPREETFDRIVSITSAVFGTSMSAITLVDRERSWHKAEVGMGVDEMPRADEMCDRTLSQDGVLVIEDASRASRDAVLPMLNFGLRFYIGAPLRTHDGVKIGTLCAMDPEPRLVSDRQKQTLQDLAKIVMDEMELRLAARTMAKAEAELRRLNEQLEVSSRNKSEFLASISHELRTPLNGILGASELLSQGLFGELNAKQLEYLADVQQCGSHLLRLIEDVLDLARIEAGHVELRREVLDTGGLMDAAASVVRGVASSHALDLVVVPPETRLLLDVDERRFVQVACNLLSNALKFSPPAGRVTFQAWREASEVVFVVQDEGPGIEPALQTRIFEQFFRAGTEQDGSGLGLPLAKQLIEMQGGRIWVESQVGNGASFFFSLPVSADGEAEGPF